MTPKAKEYRDAIREEFVAGKDSTVCSILRELSEDQELMLEVWGTFPATVRSQFKEMLDNYDPTPWCHQCGARKQADCKCGPIADNN